MKSRVLFGSAATVLAACVTLVGRARQAPAPKTDQKADQKEAAAVTVAGCVQKETDVLKPSMMAGNTGMGDQFVLTHAVLNQGAASAETPAPGSPAQPAASVGTSGTTDVGTVYRVTGDKEKALNPYVGQRVEITGAANPDTHT